ncbi:hypothetical protein CFC21_043636 [Triticum aestivum]|uniref:Protein kinase domain-containing protein n=2 Tax=Triticum aestivum TaxID=4565 RepID=A0A9R1JWR4_WHEAT|nr:hypothetical protein CFC21_043636 [Triticum aestivum]CDM85835.1 unnamed protein product [Triticum aestivum]
MATVLSFSFNFSSSGDLCETELRCERDARMGSDAIELTKNELKANFFSVGRASYARLVPLCNNATGKVASFSSNFTLPPNSVGENLALFNDSNRFNAAGDDRIVTVEFDAYPNSWDHNDNHLNHIGIDVNNINSSAYTNVTKRLVSNDAVMTAEINYDNHTGVLIARLRINDDEPDMVNTSVDMKADLPHGVAIGFAASTGLCSELHQAEFERGIGPRRYRYRELAAATKDFAEEGKLGRGGFGNGRKEFESEVKIISRLRHRSGSRKGLLLVYELVLEGSLDRHIYNTDRLLTWSERYRIILGLGSALHYLHTEWDQWYIDPEFVRTRRPTAESDVYSFGIVVLEVVSGQRPDTEMEMEQPTTADKVDRALPLLKWIWNLYEKSAIVEAVDERIKRDKQLDDCKWQLHRALVVGLWCTHPSPCVRPSVVQLMNFLQSEDLTLPILSRPGPDFSPGSHAYNASSSVNVCSDDVSWATTGR